MRNLCELKKKTCVVVLIEIVNEIDLKYMVGIHCIKSECIVMSSVADVDSYRLCWVFSICITLHQFDCFCMFEYCCDVL